jgi:hypothetical protein
MLSLLGGTSVLDRPDEDSTSPDPQIVIERICRGEAGAEVAFARLVWSGTLFLIRCRIGDVPAASKIAQDVLTATISAIRARGVEPPAVLSYMRELVYAATTKVPPAQSRKRISGPEQRAIAAILKALHPAEGELLRRYYVEGETPEEVCAALGLQLDEFRLVKSRVLGLFQRAIAERNARGASA